MSSTFNKINISNHSVHLIIINNCNGCLHMILMMEFIGYDTKISSSSKNSGVVYSTGRILNRRYCSSHDCMTENIRYRSRKNKYNCNHKAEYAGNKPILKRMLHKSTSTYL